MCWTHRRMFSILADELLRRGDKKRALEVLEKCDKEIPDHAVSYTNNIGGTTELARCWAQVGKKDKAEKLLTQLIESSRQYLDWYMFYSANSLSSNTSECTVRISEMLTAVNVMRKENLPNSQKYTEMAEKYYGMLSSKGINLNFGN